MVHLRSDQRDHGKTFRIDLGIRTQVSQCVAKQELSRRRALSEMSRPRLGMSRHHNEVNLHRSEVSRRHNGVNHRRNAVSRRRSEVSLVRHRRDLHDRITTNRRRNVQSHA